MNRPIFIFNPRRCAFAVLMLCTSMIWAAEGPTTRSNHPTEGDAQANIHVVAPPPPTRSPLDFEPIRRGTATDSTQPATAQNHAQGLDLPKVAGALAIVIGLILLLRWGGKKVFPHAGTGRSTQAIQVLARSSLSPRQQIVLIRVGKRIIVVGDSGSQMNPLSEITDTDEVASLLGQLSSDKPDFSAKAFNALFHRAKREMNTEPDESSDEEHSGPADESDPSIGEVAVDPAINDTRDEITGLMEKIRGISKQMRGSP